MKALVKYARGVGNVALREVSEPRPAPGQVLVEVRATGICGTDIHIYYDEYRSAPPVVLGHEFSGVVVEVGPGVQSVQVGNRVTVRPIAYVCGRCLPCRTGSPQICPQRRSLGTTLDGAFARYVVAPEDSVYPLPDGVDFPAGALAEPLTVAVHAVAEQARIGPGDVVVITGPGAIGLLSAQVAKAAGATVVLTGMGRDRHRLEVGRALGVDRVVDVEGEDPVEVALSLTDGRGADAAFECSGAATGAQQALSLVRRRGQYVQVGLFGRAVSVDLDLVATREIAVLGSFSGPTATWTRALRLVAGGVVRLAPLVSDVLPLSEWRAAFSRVEEKEGLKIVLEPPS